MLNEKIAQSIVLKTMSVIDYDVNIMDENAYIIASANEDRIGDFHLGASKVIKTGRSLSINIEEAALMEGVKEGITLPIRFNNNIIGAVGIKGEPDLVIKYGELVKYTTELMVEQSYIKEILYLENKSRNNFLNDLLTGNWKKNNEDLRERGLGLDIDLEKKHLVIAIRLIFINSIKERVGTKSIVHLDSLEKKLSMNTFEYKNIIAEFINDYLVIMIPVKDKDPAIDNHKLQYEISKKVLDIVKNEIKQADTKKDPKVAIGGVSDTWQDIYKAFDNAVFAINIGSKIDPKIEILNFKDYIIEYNLSAIPHRLRNEYIDKILGKLIENEKQYNSKFLKTLNRYFHFNMSIKETSEDLFLHRNTLMSRLNRIEEISGYRPQSFKDAFYIKTAIIMLNLQDVE